MPLAVSKRSVDGVTILDLDGRLVLGDEATSARQSFTDAAASDTKHLIVNLAKVIYIDSSGLGTLIVGHSAMKETGGGMKLLHLSERHQQLMVISKLSTVFEIFDDEQLAINSFYPDREIKPFDILEFVQSQEGETAHLGASSHEQTDKNEG